MPQSSNVSSSTSSNESQPATTGAISSETKAQRPTILFLNHTASVSGAEYVLLAMLGGLDKSRFQALLASPDGELSKRAAALQIPHFVLPEVKARFTHNPLSLLRAIRSFREGIAGLRTLIRSTQPEIIHANTIRSGLVAVFAAFGKQHHIIWHLHDFLPASVAGRAIRLLAYLHPRLSAIAVSRATGSNFRSRTGERLIRHLSIPTIYNSIDMARFAPRPDVRSSMRAQLQLKSEDVAIGVVGQLTPRKNQLNFLKQFAKRRNELPGVKIFVVGAAQFNSANQVYANQIEAFVRDNALSSQVELLGARSNVDEVWNAMDIAVLNSTLEPFGLAIMEALATEVPAVVPDNTGFPESIDHGLNGFLCRSYYDMFLHITELAQDPELRHAMGAYGRQSMNRFTLDRTIKALTKAYDDILEQRDFSENDGA